MNLKEQFEAETGLEARIIVGVRIESNEYEERYVQWLESKVQAQKVSEEVWTFTEILDAAYPILGRGSDWCKIATTLRQKFQEK